jgi:ribosome-binding ATPase YchF (GTP1/OBG family)
MGGEELKKAAAEVGVLEKLVPLLSSGKAVRGAALSADELSSLYDCHLITAKPMLYICNTDEAGAQSGSPHIEAVRKIAASEGLASVVICGKFEAELGGLENQADFLYFWTLHNIFNEFLENISEDILPNEASGFKESRIWNMLYSFQKFAR